jgi:hypothetical protein
MNSTHIFFKVGAACISMHIMAAHVQYSHEYSYLKSVHAVSLLPSLRFGLWSVHESNPLFASSHAVFPSNPKMPENTEKILKYVNYCYSLSSHKFCRCLAPDWIQLWLVPSF